MRIPKKMRRPVVIPSEIWLEVDREANREDRDWMDMTRVLIKEALKRRQDKRKRG